MRPSTSSYIVELPLRVNDQQNRFLEKAFEFGRTLYNATLGTALGRLQRMRETQEWRGGTGHAQGESTHESVQCCSLSLWTNRVRPYDHCE